MSHLTLFRWGWGEDEQKCSQEFFTTEELCLNKGTKMKDPAGKNAEVFFLKQRFNSAKDQHNQGIFPKIKSLFVDFPKYLFLSLLYGIRTSFPLVTSPKLGISPQNFFKGEKYVC